MRSSLSIVWVLRETHLFALLADLGQGGWERALPLHHAGPLRT